MATRARRWWNEPDHFEWITQFLRQRGMLRSTQAVMATVSASASLVALSFLVGLRWPTAILLVVGLTGAVLTLGMTAFWLTRWPTRRQSEVAILVGTLFVAVWSVVQPSTAVAMLACTATAVTGGYIAFFHNTRLLVLNFGVAIAIAASASSRLADDTNLATAVAAFWLVWFLNLTVPLAIRGITKAMSTYAMRSDADPLTGLLNRRGFADAIARQRSDAPDSATHLGLVMVDLDNFKLVNDTQGHAAGDRTLLAVSELLRQHSPHDAAICRAGGEEFLIAVTTTRGGAESAAAQLCRAIAELPLDVTASLGTCSIDLEHLRTRDADSLIDDLIAAADSAMYVAKRNGGNQVQFGSRFGPVALSEHMYTQSSTLSRPERTVADYKTIIVGTDGSDTSLRAVDKAAALAAETGATLIVATVYSTRRRDAASPDPDQPGREDYRTEGDAPVYDLLRDAAARARAHGAHDVRERAVEGVPADALVALADEVGADLLVVGSVGFNSVVGRLVGSVPRIVRKQAGTEVLVVDTEG